MTTTIDRDDGDAVVPHKSGDELRAEFTSAQQQRRLKRGVILVRETDLPNEGPTEAEAPPPK